MLFISEIDTNCMEATKYGKVDVIMLIKKSDGENQDSISVHEAFDTQETAKLEPVQDVPFIGLC